MAKPTSSPFVEIDVSRIMSEYKFPGVDVDAIMASQRRNIEAVTAANQLAIEGMQAVMRRQVDIFHQTLEETGYMLAEVMGNSTPEERIVKQSELVKIAFEKALSNMKELTEMVAKSNAEAVNLISKRVSEDLENLQNMKGRIGR